MPAYDMTTSVVDAEGESSSVRLMHDGAGRYRSDRSYAGGRPLNIVIADGRHMYESWGPDAAGTVLWVDQGPRSTDAMFPTIGLHQHCLLGWKHRGVDLVAGRPAHHLSCGHADYWIDNDWEFVVRWQSNPDPLNGRTRLEELVSLVFARPDADRFDCLPAPWSVPAASAMASA